MAEKFANTGLNVAITTLSGKLDPGVTAMQVQAANLNAFPALQGAGNFRIEVGNEVMTVVGPVTSATWIVQRGREGTTDASHAGGTKVFHKLTAGGLTQALEDAAGSGGGISEFIADGGTPSTPISEFGLTIDFGNPVGSNGILIHKKAFSTGSGKSPEWPASYKLKTGEIGLEINTGIIKIGDETERQWSLLTPWASVSLSLSQVQEKFLATAAANLKVEGSPTDVNNTIVSSGGVLKWAPGGGAGADYTKLIKTTLGKEAEVVGTPTAKQVMEYESGTNPYKFKWGTPAGSGGKISEKLAEFEEYAITLSSPAAKAKLSGSISSATAENPLVPFFTNSSTGEYKDIRGYIESYAVARPELATVTVPGATSIEEGKHYVVEPPAAWIDAPASYAKGVAVSYGGLVYTSSKNSNSGNKPDEKPTWWALASYTLNLPSLIFAVSRIIIIEKRVGAGVTVNVKGSIGGEAGATIAMGRNESILFFPGELGAIKTWYPVGGYRPVETSEEVIREFLTKPLQPVTEAGSAIKIKSRSAGQTGPLITQEGTGGGLQYQWEPDGSHVWINTGKAIRVKKVAGDTYDRLQLLGEGAIVFGPGTGTNIEPDTKIKRGTRPGIVSQPATQAAPTAANLGTKGLNTGTWLGCVSGAAPEVNSLKITTTLGEAKLKCATVGAAEGLLAGFTAYGPFPEKTTLLVRTADTWTTSAAATATTAEVVTPVGIEFKEGDTATDTKDGTTWTCAVGSKLATPNGTWINDGNRGEPAAAATGVLAHSYDLAMSAAKTQLAAGVVYLTKVMIPRPNTEISKVCINLVEAGDELENCFAAVIRSDGTLLKKTADRATNWKKSVTSTGAEEMPFSPAGSTEPLGGPGVFVWVALLANIKPPKTGVTAATTDVITLAAHSLSNNQKIEFSSLAPAGTGLNTATPYWVISVPTSETFKVSLTKSGPSVDITSAVTSGTLVYLGPLPEIACAQTSANFAALPSTSGGHLRDLNEFGGANATIIKENMRNGRNGVGQTTLGTITVASNDLTKNDPLLWVGLK